MAFAVAQDKDAPESTTVASYSVQRLTGVQTLKTSMVETKRGWLPLQILAAVDANADGVFEELHVAQNATLTGITDPSQLVGREVVDLAAVHIGLVATGVTVAPVLASQGNPGSPGYYKLTLASGGLTSAAATNLQIAQLSFFGAQVQNPSGSGRAWELSLTSTDPTQALRMQTIMVSVHAALITAALAALNITGQTSAAIQAAAVTMLQTGNTVDSFIASQMEQLELDRRSGAFTSLTVMGTAPQA